VEKRAELKTAEHNVHQLQAERRSIEAKFAEAKAGYMADATDRRTKALMKISQLNQDITKARQKESYRRLMAPVDGTVQGLKIHTSGAVVTTADTLMTIVPDGAGIEVDCLVPNKDIGFVGEGQNVEVKLEAFPFTRYGLVQGRVRKLGRDAATNPNTAPPGSAAAMAQTPTTGLSGAPLAELAYPAKVTLLQDWILVDGRHENPRRHARLRRNQDWRPPRDRIPAFACDAGGQGSGEGEMSEIANSLRYRARRAPICSVPSIHNIRAPLFRKTLVPPRSIWHGGASAQPACLGKLRVVNAGSEL
jgi:hypothetical protein